jgi:hypothetical protein
VKQTDTKFYPFYIKVGMNNQPTDCLGFGCPLDQADLGPKVRILRVAHAAFVYDSILEESSSPIPADPLQGLTACPKSHSLVHEPKHGACRRVCRCRSGPNAHASLQHGAGTAPSNRETQD